MVCSMSRVGGCWDNAPMETSFGSLKTDLKDDGSFPTRQAARTSVFDFIEGFYNPHRRHSALDYESPISYEKKHRAAA